MSGGANGLDVCLVCRQAFVSLVRATPAENDCWWLLLRCGECGTWHETVARGDAVEALEQAIDRGLAEELRALRLDQLDLDDFLPASRVDQLD
jgi:hypothetical protein